MPPEVLPLDDQSPIADSSYSFIPDYGLSDLGGQTTSTLGDNAISNNVEAALLPLEPILLRSGEPKPTTDIIASRFAGATGVPSEEALSDSDDDEAASGDPLLFTTANVGENPAIVGQDSASALLAVNARIPNAEPTLEWLRQFGSVGSPSPRDIGTDIAFAGNDSVIVVGEKGGDGFLAEYSLDGEQVWLTELGTDRPDTIEAVAVSESSIFVAGTTGGSLDGQGTGLGNDAFIAKYDLVGNLQWVNQLGTPQTDQGYSVTVDAQGNAYLTGSTRGSLPENKSGGGSDAFLAKFSDDGDLVWTRQLSLSGSQEGNVVASDDAQNVYVAGSSGFRNGFIAKFDASGQQQWDEQLDSFNYVRDLEVSSSGNLYLGGATRSSLSDAIIKKLDTDGDLVWTQELATPQNDFVESLEIGSDGTIYAVGSTRGELGDTSFGNSDLFLSSFDTEGNLNWVEQFGSPANDSANGLAIDSQGNFYLAGDTFGDLEGVSAGSSDIFVAKFGNVASGDVDLAGASFEVMQKPLVAGETFDVEFEVDNLGSSVASAFTVDFYLSTDTEITVEDFFLDDADINFLAGEDSTGILSSSLTLPEKDEPFWSALGDATYHVGMIIDADNLVIETNEANNANTGVLADLDPVPIKLEIDENNIIDLRIRTANVQGNETKSFRVVQDRFEQRNLDISLGVENIGNVLAAAHTVQLYLSTDERIDSSDRLLQTLSLPEIAPLEVDGRELSLALPDADDSYWDEKGDGEYYIGILIDADNENDERRESNNTEFSAIQIVDTPTIDLSPTELLVLQNSENEKLIGVDFRVQNTGPTPTGQFDVDFYLSRDEEINAGDLLIDSITIDGLPGNDFTAPVGQGILLPGSRDAWWGGELQNPNGDTYYIGVVVDSKNEISEVDETDNFSQKLGRILIQDVKQPSTIDLVADLGLTEEPVPIGNGMWFLGEGIAPQDLLINKPFLADAADTINADTVWSNENLSGDGFTVGVWEALEPNGNWRIRNTHNHFSNINVQPGEGDSTEPFSNHATEVAGVIAGQRNVSERGIAFEANLISYNDSNELNELRGAFANRGVLFSNHSYGVRTGWETATLGERQRALLPPTAPLPNTADIFLGDYSLSSQEDENFGKYSQFSADLDNLLFESPQLLSVWAAGNDRDNQFRQLAQDDDRSFYITNFNTNPNITGFNWFRSGLYWVDSSIVWPNGIDNPDSTGVQQGSTDGDILDTGFDSISRGGQIAKNTLVVGSIGDISVDPISSTDVRVSNFSSWGPTDDGRVRPDVVANGENVNMPTGTADADYASKRGTSFAAPSVTGAAVLLAEKYIDERGQHPRSATTKGIFIHTAKDVTRVQTNPDGSSQIVDVGPDYRTGWGIVDLQAAADFVARSVGGNEFSTSDIQENTYTGEPEYYVYSWNGQTPLKFTMAWTDPTGTPHAANILDQRTPVLVNDLDIRVIGPDGTTTYLPWTLDPANPEEDAVRNQEPNRVDNVEQILIEADPTKGGFYQVMIDRNPNSVSFNQDYSLMVSGGVAVDESIVLLPEANDVILSINRVRGDFDRGVLNTLDRGDSDFFARVTIDGQEYVTDVIREDSDLILDNTSFDTPSWIFTRRTARRFVPIKIEIFDADRGGIGDGFSGNDVDVVDIDPTANDRTLEFTFDALNETLFRDGTEGLRAGQEIYSQGGGDSTVGELWFVIQKVLPTPLI
ncbi:hypothetical protein C7271_05840 [filamentous cyanobacterium CCP5]|nr:hypothetical protein C7271_05840 [filamentous cyanobacterium CCP5]